jgi:ubiquinone/menaquinone biosynthesis C-methylase UbiE
MPFGSEIALSPGLSSLERTYIKIFGVPILGLRIRARTILPLLRELNKPQRIADAGCGRGIITMACARMFPQAQVIGLDLNKEQIDINSHIARTFGIGNVQFFTQDALMIEDLGMFDAIITTDMFEHLADDDRCARNYFKVLNPEGFLIVHVPHITRNLFGWRRTNWMDIEGHMRPGYTRDSLIQLLNRAGFQNVRCDYNYNSIETLASNLSYFITGGRERRKYLYAAAFPFLLLIARIGAIYHPLNDGSGLVAMAHKAV